MQIPQSQYPAIAALINATYTDEIDSIRSAQWNGNTMDVMAVDSGKVLKIAINNKSIDIQMVN